MEKTKCFALIGFQEDGNSDIVCVTTAPDDSAAAAKLGGRIVAPMEIVREEQYDYVMSIPPSSSNANRSHFRFGNDETDPAEAVARLGKGCPTQESPPVEPGDAAIHSERFVLAEVPFFD